MKKEVLAAIVIGLSFGLIVSFGIYRARKSLQHTVTDGTTEIDASPNPSTSPLSTLVLLSPEDESVQSTKDTKITGTTKPNSTVIIFMNDRPTVTMADNSGNFSIQAELQPSNNIITIRSIDMAGNITEDERTVIYETASLDSVPTASFSATPTTTSKTSTTKKKTTPTPAATGN